MAATALAFFLAYVSGLALAVFVHPRYGLYVYFAVFYLDPPSRWWGIYIPDLRWSLIAAVITLIATIRLPPQAGKVHWASTTPARLLIVFTVWMWLQNAWALTQPEQLDASILFTKYVVLYYLLFRLLTTSEDVGNLLLVHVIGCAYLGWLVYLAPDAGRLEGVGGPGIDDANSLGMFASTGAVCGAMLILSERSWRRWLSMLAMPFILNAIIQTESRGAMVGLVVGAAVLFYLRPRGYKLKFYVYAAAGLVGFAYLAPQAFWDRMETLGAATDETAELDSSAESRIVLIEAQLQMAKRYPHGTGHRGTAVLSPAYLDEKWLTRRSIYDVAARSSHNTLMSALVEQGIPGILIFSGLLIWITSTIRVLSRSRKRDPPIESRALLYGSAAAASLTVVFVAGLFTDYIKTEVQIWMFAILAVIVSQYAPERQPAVVRDARANSPAAPRLTADTGSLRTRR